MQPLMRVNPSNRSLSGNKARIVPLELGKSRNARHGEEREKPHRPVADTAEGELCFHFAVGNAKGRWLQGMLEGMLRLRCCWMKG